MQGCSSQWELFMAVLAAMVHNSSVKFKVSAEGFKYLPSLKSFCQRLFKSLASSIEPLWFLQVSFKTPVALFSSLYGRNTLLAIITSDMRREEVQRWMQRDVTVVSQELLTHHQNELKASARDDWETWHEPGVINTESGGKSVWSPGVWWSQYLQILDLITFLSGIVVFRSHFAVKHAHTTAAAKLMMCNCVYCPQNLFSFIWILFQITKNNCSLFPLLPPLLPYLKPSGVSY